MEKEFKTYNANLLKIPQFQMKPKKYDALRALKKILSKKKLDRKLLIYQLFAQSGEKKKSKTSGVKILLCIFNLE